MPTRIRRAAIWTIPSRRVSANYGTIGARPPLWCLPRIGDPQDAPCAHGPHAVPPPQQQRSRRVERLRAASPYGHKADWRLVAFIVKARDELLQARAVVVAGGPSSCGDGLLRQIAPRDISPRACLAARAPSLAGAARGPSHLRHVPSVRARAPPPPPPPVPNRRHLALIGSHRGQTSRQISHHLPSSRREIRA